jgi:predicted TIM-barrel fold metal-dependent hydrolase
MFLQPLATHTSVGKRISLHFAGHDYRSDTVTAGRIDVHQHVVPPDYARWLRTKGVADAAGRELPGWDVGAALEIMDRHNIQSAILSVSTPGTTPGDPAEAAGMARAVNEFSAALSQEFPGRFGFFGTVPLPHVDLAITEARHTLEALHADGVTLLANSSGVYLGMPELDPLMAELDARSAVAFVHPATLPGPAIEGIPPFAADFLLDTSRAAYSLVRNGVIQRYPRIRFILSHAGGFVPYAAHRMALAISGVAGRGLNDVLEDFRSFYFDVALSGSPAGLPSLLQFAKPDHVLFGTDWPFAPSAAVSYFTAQFDKWEGMSVDTRVAVNRGNAEKLFQRFDRSSR